MENEKIAYKVAEYVEQSSGWFHTDDIYKSFSISIENDKVNVRMCLSRLVQKGLLKRDTKQNGRYKKVENELIEMDFAKADPTAEFKLLWPFSLERYVRIMPKSIVVVAGSPNSGKTSFLLNVVAKNQGAQHIAYFNSEMAVEEFKLRLDCFDWVDGWCFQAFERSGNFSDCIFPDSVNIIDFMEINDEFYKIASELTAIHDKLRKGIAIVAIQKNPPKRDMKGKMVANDMGRGGVFGLEKPRLYLSMDTGHLKIVKAKIWQNPQINPNNKVFSFKLVNGSQFVNITEEIAKQEDMPF
jgi:hypothetical protein